MPAPVPPWPTRGLSVATYVVRRLIASGATAMVFEAYDARLQRRVALKILADSARAREDSLDEARALARVCHPSVATVYDVGSVDDRAYIAMEYVAGETLGAWARRARTWRQIARVAVEVGRGLVALHRAGLVHRDVKPSNIMVDGNGRPRLIDFGLAAPAARPSRHAAGSGTPRYMAPEQHVDQIPDPRSDQYAYAITIREVLERASDRRTLDDRVEHWLSRASAARPAARFARLDTLVDRLAGAVRSA